MKFTTANLTIDFDSLFLNSRLDLLEILKFIQNNEFKTYSFTIQILEFFINYNLLNQN